MKPDSSAASSQLASRRVMRLHRDKAAAATAATAAAAGWRRFIGAHHQHQQQQQQSATGRALLRMAFDAIWHAIAEAVQRGDEARARQWLRLAAAHSPGCLSCRGPRLESLLMLAGAAGMADLAGDLLRRDAGQVYRLYDTYGRNALHYCALGSNERCLATVLGHLLMSRRSLSAQANIQQLYRGLLAALDMPDRDGARPADLLPRTPAGDRLAKLMLAAAEATATAAASLATAPPAA